MDRRQELSDFLRSRRARLSPADVGLGETGRNRRVHGLRREEVAMLASISMDYYVRLEQGRIHGLSQSVLDSVSSALRLDRDEQAHLRNLAGPERSEPRRRPKPAPLRPGLTHMVASVTSGPAYVLGRHMQVLAWNYLAELIFEGVARLPHHERNIARYVFLDPTSRCTFGDWREAARSTAGYLRVVGGQHPDDVQLTALVGELSLKSEDFRRWWAEHNVSTRTYGDKTFVHPLVGPLELNYEVLSPSMESGEMVFVFYPRPGSDAQTALQMLASWGRQEDPSSTSGPRAAPARAHLDAGGRASAG